MLLSDSNMGDHTKSGSHSLSTVQQSVADALGSGSTISGAAEELDVSRVTIYNWIKTRKDFAAAIQRARAEFVRSRRDGLQYLSGRALESVIAILDDPSTPSSVREPPCPSYSAPRPPRPRGTRPQTSRTEPPPPSESTAGPTDFTKSYTFTRNSGVNPPAHCQTGLHSCPVPPAVAEARDQHLSGLEAIDEFKAFQKGDCKRRRGETTGSR
jgi:hypothetical protein